MDPTLQKLRRQLRELDGLRGNGALDAKAYDAARAALERQIADRLLAIPAGDGADPPPVAGVMAKPRRGFLAQLAALAVLFALAGYAWLGNPSMLIHGDVLSAAAPGAAASSPHALGSEQMADLAERLAERLRQQPDDPEGWVMLARSYGVLGQHDKAVPAFRKAAALRKDDAALLADFADALAMTLGRSLEGEPLKLVEQALKVEPGNLKALSLAGTAAFNRKDYAGAVRYWEKMREVAPDDNVLVKQIEGGIAEARQLGGLPSAQPKPGGAAAAAASPAAREPAMTAPGEGRVSGTVTLAPALAAKTSPEDVVFVFARPAEGARMPLAILRRQVKDLPMEFTLDDSMALSPATKLSSQSRVVVGARISKSGQATPQPGDLQGQTAAVALGSSGLKIEVGEVVGR